MRNNVKVWWDTRTIWMPSNLAGEMAPLLKELQAKTNDQRSVAGTHMWNS